jgi:hypothetical protein
MLHRGIVVQSGVLWTFVDVRLGPEWTVCGLRCVALVLAQSRRESRKLL